MQEWTKLLQGEPGLTPAHHLREELKGKTSMTTIHTNPKVTWGEYDVIAYQATYGTPSQVYAMVYRTGTRKAIWETLSFDTVEQAFASAREWIEAQNRQERIAWLRELIPNLQAQRDGFEQLAYAHGVEVLMQAIASRKQELAALIAEEKQAQGEKRQ